MGRLDEVPHTELAEAQDRVSLFKVLPLYDFTIRNPAIA